MERPVFRPLPLAALACALGLSWGASTATCQDRLEDSLRTDIGALAAMGSRVAGYPGAAQAEQYVRDRLRQIGFDDLDQQEFDIVSPVDKGSALTLASGEVIPLHPVWPNLVATSTVLPGEADGRIVWGGAGELYELDGRPIDGSIVLMDFNCGTRWLNAAMLGASAVIFAEPEETTRQDAQEKFSRVPVDFPRFYLTAADGAGLVARVRSAEQGSITGEIVAKVDWQEVPARTIIAKLQGTDPELSQESIVIQAYYDSMSVVPDLAPGAEQACGIAAFLSIAESLVADPPARSVVLVASPGHFMGLAGMRSLADVFGAKGRRPAEQAEFYRRGVRDEEKLIARIETAMADTETRRDKIAELSRSTDPEDIKRYQLELTARGPVDFDAELARMRRQVALLRDNLRLMADFRREEHVPLAISLDLTSRSRQFGVAFAGNYFDDSTVIRFLSPLGKRLSASAEELAGEQGWDFERLWFDGTNPKQDKNWWDYFPGRVAFESEMVLRAGRPAITLATGSDRRPLFDTPMDTPDLVDYGSVAFQTRNITELLKRFLSDPDLDSTAFKRTKRLKLPYRMYPLVGRVLEFVRQSSFLPQTPVPDALVVVRGASKGLMGVRTDLMTVADGAGLFSLAGHQNGGLVDAYFLDPDTGNIRYAPDLGPEGERQFTRAIWQRGRQDRPLIVFPCEPISLFDLVDQRYLETLEQVFIYNAKTDAEPHAFGYEVPIFTPPAGETGLAVEPCAVVFTEPGEPVKMTLGMGLLGARMLLLGSSPAEPAGRGFTAEETHNRINFTVYQAARDMHLIDEKRINDFVLKGVKNPQVEGLHKDAALRLDQVDAHLNAQEYDKAVALARAAWAYESSAYPDVQKTARDVVYGVVFYLGLLLSFTYFAERLVISAVTVQGRIAGSVGIFLAVFILLRLVHPAFDLAINPFIILLAFVVLALALIVITIVVGKFNQQLEQLKQELGGIHKADVSRTSAAAMAFSLGVANMRRRGTRTALTCVTLVLVTFTVLSFTSVRTGVQLNKIPRGYDPAYTGILMRDKVWVQLEDTIPEVMRNEWAGRYTIAPRAWQISADITKKANYLLESYTDPTVTYTAHAMLGLSPQEAEVSVLADKLLPGGRWFDEKDSLACILPSSVADKMGITAEAVARWNSQSGRESVGPQPRTQDERVRVVAGAFGPDAPVIVMSGSAYVVIGIMPDEVLDGYRDEDDPDKSIPGFRDLDGESLTPVDFSQLKPEVLNQVREMASQRFKLGRMGVSSLLQNYEHYLANATVIIAYSQCLRIGGTTRSVAMLIGSVDETRTVVDEYMRRLAVSVYATGQDARGKPRVFLFSSIGRKSLDGAETVLIPVLIAAMIVLNTMLGAVWERVKEIHVFSSVGLSPTHVGALFLAESCVYANIGAILGYLLGQGLTKILILTHSLGAVQTNYSSLSAVFATLVVLATVLLSTVWPARKAAQIAVPDIERRWRLPEPQGDEMVIPMPFTVTGRDAPACNAFLEEFFQAYVGYAGGDFYAEDVHLGGVRGEHGEGYSLSLRVWLAPYDLGVSQAVELRTEPTGEYSIFELTISIHREAGDTSSWKKTNWLFLNIIRKQFLIWRTVPVEQKERYAQRTTALVEGGVGPDATGRQAMAHATEPA